ncbi:MAG: DUF4190 domain-containing protein [Pseudolysinimonas sp.]
MADSSTPQAGWYTDPENPAAERWWNGASWSESRRDSTTTGATYVPPGLAPTPPDQAPAPVAPIPPVPPADTSGFTFGSATPAAARVDPYAAVPAPGYAAPGYVAAPGYTAAPGYPASPYGAQPYGAAGQGTNGLALAGLIVSSAGWLIISFLGPIAGIVLSALGLQAAKRRELMGIPNSGRGMAMAGLVIGIVILGLIVIMLILLLAVNAATSRYNY